MIDCAQWWLYEQTSFRQLSEIYRAEEFMGPREAHVQNEKEPPSPLLGRPASPFFTSRQGAHSAWWCRWAWHRPAKKIECHLIMQPSCGKHGVCNQIDRRSSRNPLGEADKVRREQGMVAPGTTPDPEKCTPLPPFSGWGLSTCSGLQHWPSATQIIWRV